MVNHLSIWIGEKKLRLIKKLENIELYEEDGAFISIVVCVAVFHAFWQWTFLISAKNLTFSLLVISLVLARQHFMNVNTHTHTQNFIRVYLSYFHSIFDSFFSMLELHCISWLLHKKLLAIILIIPLCELLWAKAWTFLWPFIQTTLRRKKKRHCSLFVCIVTFCRFDKKYPIEWWIIAWNRKRYKAMWMSNISSKCTPNEEEMESWTKEKENKKRLGWNLYYRTLIIHTYWK